MKIALIAIMTLFAVWICRAADTPEFYTGTCTHFGQNKGILSENISMIKEAGIVAIRDEVYWGGVEKIKGQYQIPEYFDRVIDEAAKHRIQPLVILDYGNQFYDNGGYPTTTEAIEGYTRYCEAVVRHAGDRVRLFQIWNEWDGGCGMRNHGRGTAEGYVNLIKVVYPRLKKIAPQATFIANSVCTGEKFMEDTFKLGVLDYCDAISFHTYNFSAKLPDPTASWLTRMQNLQKLIRQYNQGQDKSVFVTEMGWPNQITGAGSSEEESAVHLARLYLYARTLPFVKGVWWYDFQDDGYNAKESENNFGLVRPDLTPKLPYFAMKSLAGPLSRGQLVDSVTCDGLLLLRLRDGNEIFWAAVNQDPGNDLQLILETSNPQGQLQVELVGSAPVKRRWGLNDWGKDGKLPFASNRFSVIVGKMPLLISGDLASASIKEIRKIPFNRTTLTAKNGAQLPAVFAQVLHKGETAPPTAFLEYQKLTDPDYAGKNDLSATFEANYERDALWLTIAVKDNVFCQPETAIDNGWRGDGLQLAFQNIDANGSQYRTELDAALINGEPAVMIREAQGNRDKKAECTIERQGNLTIYRLRIPAQLLGVKAFEPGTMLTAAFLVNDNDAKGRKGFQSWGKGIGLVKDPKEYNLLIFQ